MKMMDLPGRRGVPARRDNGMDNGLNLLESSRVSRWSRVILLVALPAKQLIQAALIPEHQAETPWHDSTSIMPVLQSCICNSRAMTGTEFKFCATRAATSAAETVSARER